MPEFNRTPIWMAAQRATGYTADAISALVDMQGFGRTPGMIEVSGERAIIALDNALKAVREARGIAKRARKAAEASEK